MVEAILETRYAGQEPASSIVPLPPGVLGDTHLGVQFEVHDSQQLELRFRYGLGQNRGAQKFEVDTYLFVPRNVGLNASNYSKDQFYADVNALIRLDAAPLTLEQLANPDFPESPLTRISAALEQFETSAIPPRSRPITVQVKLYAYMHTEAVKNELRRLRELLQGTACGPEVDEARAHFLGELDHTIERIRRSLRAYRRLRCGLWPYEKLCHQSLNEATRLADEHMSFFLEERLGLLAAALDEDPRRLDGSGFVPRAKAAIAALAKEESEHRKRYGFLTLSNPEKTSPEYFTYRSSLIKKAIHQALYLDPRKVQADTFVRNAIGAVGAALAAIWALATQLPATVANLPPRTQMLFFAFGVLAYVTKDRIKAVTNEYLTRKLRKYDHSTRIYGTTLEDVGLGMIKAKLLESMRFLAYAAVPETVRRVRLERRTVRQIEALSHEEVIHYRKVLLVEETDEAEPLPLGYGLRDILRLNVRHFLVRLDDPLETVRYYDSDRDTFVETKLPKVYHVNVVLEIRSSSEGHAPEPRHEHLRLVLDKRGIVRVERVR